jgi:hypothetical protein
MKVKRRERKMRPGELWKCGNLAKSGEIPTFPQLGRSGLEKWKTKGRFPTFPALLREYDPGFASQKPKTGRSAGCARPRGGGAPRRLKSNCR